LVPTDIHVGAHDVPLGVDVVSVEVGTVAGTLLGDPERPRRRVVTRSPRRHGRDTRQFPPLVKVSALFPQIDLDRGTSTEMISVPKGRPPREVLPRPSPLPDSGTLAGILSERSLRPSRVARRIEDGVVRSRVV